jgi:RNA-directed DNA polymerase
MLTALEQGVRGGHWYTLIDKVYALPTLHAAFTRVKANRGAPGVDHVTVAMFERRLDAHLAALSTALRDGTYRPQPIRRHWIPKGPREAGVGRPNRRTHWPDWHAGTLRTGRIVARG